MAKGNIIKLYTLLLNRKVGVILLMTNAMMIKATDAAAMEKKINAE